MFEINNCKEVILLKDMTFLMTAILMTSLKRNESLQNLGLGRFKLRNGCSIWAPNGMLAAGSEIFLLSDPTIKKHCIYMYVCLPFKCTCLHAKIPSLIHVPVHLPKDQRYLE